MKKLSSLALAALMLASVLASCAPAAERLDPAITLASSDAQANAAWLDERLGTFPTEVILGVGSSAAFGVDMSDFEEDGYILRTIGEETFIFGKSAAGLDRAVRAYAKAAEAGVAESLDETYHEGERVKRLTIAGNDISEYTIYYSSDNNAGMIFAADSFKKLVKKACGVELEIKEGDGEGKYISLSFLSDDTFKDGGFVYRVENGNVIIEGVETFGCANAVNRFFEEECGWESLTFGDSVLAESEHVDVKDGASFTGNPRFEYFYPYIGGFPWKTDAASPNSKQTSYGESVGSLYTGRPLRACHGIQNSKWISEEWYSIANNDQPCYSNEEVYDEMYGNILAFVESQVNGGKRIGVELQSIDVSHPDTMNFCFCKDCMKVYKAENRTHAGVVVQFTNRLIEDMRDAGYDGIKYLIFGYQGTQKPCKTVPDTDMYVTFCTDRCCANHALNDGECDYGTFYSDMTNQVLSQWLEGWLALTPNVHVWHYGLDNGLGSDNHMDTLYEDLLYFDEIGVLGIFMEFEYMGFSLNRVTNQLGHLINWDTDMTKEEYIAHRDRLLEKEYGDGWEYVRECVRYWTEGENQNGCWHCWDFFLQIPEQYPPYAAANYDTVYSLAKKAIPLANTEEQEIRCIKFLALMIYQASAGTYFTAYDDGDEEKLAFLEERWTEMITLLQGCGINIDAIVGISPHGLATTCEEEAWTEWVISRKKLSYSENTARPAPEKYK